jgi:hypothetical protein
LLGIIRGNAAGLLQTPLAFQFQFHAWIPVSIVCAILASAISPHVHVHDQFQVDGSVGALGGTGAGGGMVAAVAVAAAGVDAGSAGSAGAGSVCTG